MNEEMLAALLAGQVPTSLSPDAISAVQQGLSRTDLSALLTPALGVGSGVVNEQVLAEGLRNYLLQAMQAAERDYTASQSELLPPVTPVQTPIVGQIQNKWRAATQNDPELGRLINTALLNVYQFGGNPEGELAALQTALGGTVDSNGRFDFSTAPQLPAGLEEDLRTLVAERDFNQRAERDYQQELAAYNQSVAALPEPAPLDYEQLRRDYFSEIGLPALAQLPAPGQQYEFTPEQVLALRKPTQRGTTRTLAESMLAARREPFKPSGGPASQMPGPIADVSGPSGAQRVLSRQAQVDPLKAIIGAEEDTARLRAARAGRTLAAKGRTPFQDAMRQLLGIGVLEASQ